MKNLKYMSIDSAQTLREAVFELRFAEKAEKDAAQYVAAELLDDVDVHDAIHVLFGCSTNLRDEVIAHVWTVFGTTMKMKDMARVNLHKDHRQVLSNIGHGRVLKTWAWAVPQITSVILRAVKMKRRWPVEEYSSFLDQRLCDIRKSFNIHPLPSSGGGNISSGAALRSVRTHAS